MKTISNEQKAKDITKCLWFPQKCTEGDIQNMLMQMAEWKDKCFANMINKIVERANNIVRDFISAEDSETYDAIQKGFFTIDDFKEILEEQS